MTTVCRPVLVFPEHEVSSDEIIEHTAALHSEHPRLGSALSLMRGTSVRTRYLIDPFEHVTGFRSFGERMQRYARAGTDMGTVAAERAMRQSETRGDEVDNLIVVSCTGYLLPGLDAHIANRLALRAGVRRFSFAQVGCAGGAYALARARELATSYPGSVTLIVVVELCSLSYQPQDDGIASFVSTALFGDAVAACVVRDERPGMRLDDSYEALAPDTLGHISYTVDELGFHFDTNPRISRVVAEAMPEVAAWLHRRGSVVPPDFLISHTGGPRIMYEVSKGLEIPMDMFVSSQTSLKDRGNTAAAVVFDVLERNFSAARRPDDSGLMIAFGPGVTTVVVTGTWIA